jgi:hypothetical protein
LVATLIAVEVYLYIGSPRFPALYGADIAADCKEPCKDDNELIVKECDDLDGIVGQCVITRCMVNKLLYLTCTPKADAGSTAADCQYWNDKSATSRWITVKIQDCDDKGYQKYDKGECADFAGRGNYVDTPCVTDTCEGDIYDGIDNQPEWDNQTKCGTPPAPAPGPATAGRRRRRPLLSPDLPTSC